MLGQVTFSEWSHLCLEVDSKLANITLGASLPLLDQNAQVNPTPRPEHSVCTPRVKCSDFTNGQFDNILNLQCNLVLQNEFKNTPEVVKRLTSNLLR